VWLKRIELKPVFKLVFARTEKSNLIGWPQADVITSQSHSPFACSREKKLPRGKRVLVHHEDNKLLLLPKPSGQEANKMLQVAKIPNL
jgi:hypothetical protein